MVPSTHSTNRHLLSALASVACFFCVLPSGLAQEGDAKPSPAAIEKAKQHYANALDHHGHKEYLAAAKEYERAYALFPNAEFVFNAAQVYRLAGEVRIALERYQRYLNLDKEGRGAGDARAHIASLKIELEALEKKEAQEKLAADQRRVDEKRVQEERLAAARASGESVSAYDPGDRRLRIAGIASASFGIVALALGGKFGLDAKELEDSVASNGVWKQQEFDDGEAAERNAFIFFGLGSAALVTGGILYFFGREIGSPPKEKQALRFMPTAGSESAGFVVKGSF